VQKDKLDGWNLVYKDKAEPVEFLVYEAL